MFIEKDSHNALCCLTKVGGVGDLGEVKVLWGEPDCVCVPGGCSGGNVSVVTTLMVEGGANVPTVDSIC